MCFDTKFDELIQQLAETLQFEEIPAEIGGGRSSAELGMLLRERLRSDWSSGMLASMGSQVPNVGIIGYIIAGLIGYWMVRQGILETVCTVLSAAIIVRLIMTLAFGGWMA